VTGAGIAVIAVVCIGFLVFLVVLGVARIRSTQRRTVEVNMEERQEMEWDNSALNITVNPLDHEVQAGCPSCRPTNSIKAPRTPTCVDLQHRDLSVNGNGPIHTVFNEEEGNQVEHWWEVIRNRRVCNP